MPAPLCGKSARSVLTGRRAANLHKSSSWGVVGTTPRGPNGRRARAERPSAGMKATDAFRRVHAFSPSSRPFAEFAPSPSSPLPPSSRPSAEVTPFRRVHPHADFAADRRPVICTPLRVLSDNTRRGAPLRHGASGPVAGCRLQVAGLGLPVVGFGCRIEGIFPALKFPGRFPGSRVRQAARGKSREACASAVRLTSPPVTRPGSGAFWWSSLGTRRGSGRAAARGPVSRKLRRPHVTVLDWLPPRGVVPVGSCACVPEHFGIV